LGVFSWKTIRERGWSAEAPQGGARRLASPSRVLISGEKSSWVIPGQAAKATISLGRLMALFRLTT